VRHSRRRPGRGAFRRRCQAVAGQREGPRRAAPASPCPDRRSTGEPGHHPRPAGGGRAPHRAAPSRGRPADRRDADDLAGGLHPGPRDGSTPRKLGGRERRRLDRHEGGRRPQTALPAHLGQGRSEGDPDRELDHRDAGDLRQERDRSRGARVDLDEIDAVVADDELCVDEASGARARTIRSIVATIDPGPPHRPSRGGKTPTESPLCTPARSTCSSSPDQHALAVADRIDVTSTPSRLPIDPNGAVRNPPPWPPPTAGRGRRASSRSRSPARR